MAVVNNDKGTVVLLRDVKSPKDRYKDILVSNGYKPEFVPVLDFNYIRAHELADALHSHDKYSGIVFTSQVAVQASANAIGSASIDHWCKAPVFVVGSSTKEAVKQLLHLDGIGETCGNGRSLGHFIVEYYQSHPNTSPDLPLLFPCGNLHKDSLPTVLSDADIPLHCMVCYETVSHSLIEPRLSTLPTLSVCSVVFFSPSGVEYAFDIIHQILLSQQTHIKVCAIGPSTSESLRVKCTPLSIAVHEAANPTPDDLLRTIMD